MTAARPWTDEEIGFLQDHAGKPVQWVAEELGRTPKAIKHARNSLRKGVLGAKKKAQWTEDEDAILVDAGASRSARELTELLPGRTKFAVEQRRERLGIVARAGTRPFDVGDRPLVAKTCGCCGLLLAGSWFSFRKTKSPGWGSYCRKCNSVAARRSLDSDPARFREAGRRAYQRLQAASLEGADRRGEPWTEDDYSVLADTALTDFQKALRLRRTYASVMTARKKAGFSSAPEGLGDPERDVWVIDNPNLKESAA